MEVATYSQISRQNADNPKIQLIQLYPVDFDFVSVYSLKIISGHELSRLYGDDKQKLMINEKAFKFFGFSSADEAIGKKLVIDSEVPMEIAGVISNFHQQSLDKAYLPMVFIYQGTIWWFQS
jgi:putative ABC transport system permease protein